MTRTIALIPGSVKVGLRKALDLYANLRPVWNLPSVPSRLGGPATTTSFADAICREVSSR